MKQGKIEQFQHLSNFSSLKDFNNHIEMIMCDYKNQFTRSEIIAFKALKRYAVKVLGVSFACVKTLVEASELQGKRISETTFHRMRRKAVKLGIIQVISTRQSYGKHKNKQGANIWVFLRYEDVRLHNSQNGTLMSKEETEEILLNQHSIQDESEKMTLPKENKIYKTNKSNLDIRREDNVIKNVPEIFQTLAKCYYSAKEVLELWKCVQHSTKYLTYYTQQDTERLAIRAFKQMICNIKLGYRVKKSIFAYYHGILNGLLDREYEEIVSSIAIV
ncbi:hypothetical protein ACQKJC_08935 [Priestia koreensis]|uniref:hypothetical protein n=1 Tax=Priestia koreensis TaxID=284581 RepID=UPI003D01E89A